jgi:hypothetical protein
MILEWKRQVKWKDKEVIMMAETMAGAKCSKSEYDAFMSLLEEQDAANIAELYTPMAFASKKKRIRIPRSYVEALSGDHAEQYWIAMQDEIDALIKRRRGKLYYVLNVSQTRLLCQVHGRFR